MQEVEPKTNRQIIRELFQGVEAGRFSGSLENQAALTLSSLTNPLIWGEEKVAEREKLLEIARDLTGVVLQESQGKVSYPRASWGDGLGPT